MFINKIRKIIINDYYYLHNIKNKNINFRKDKKILIRFLRFIIILT